MKKIKILVLSFLLGGFTYGQGPIGNPPANNVNAKANAAWYRGGNFIGGTTPPGANIFGTMWNSPIHIFTSSTHRATWTTNNSLSSWNNNMGDGLRIHNPLLGGSGGNLDLFTSSNLGQNETHARFGNSGQVSG
ncbi:MAG: hypothetical protein RQ875_07045 [Vicingaceae bacterium]|nr:hypothetical protein [Vicingaceae bacterium]